MILAAAITRRGPVEVTWRVERRWAMNFAAAVGDDSAVYFGRQDTPPDVHPLYHAQIEWRLGKLVRTHADMPVRVKSRAIHATQHLQLERLLRVGETITSRAEIIGAEPARSGTRLTTQFSSLDRDGQQIAMATATTVYPGVELGGEPVTPGVVVPAFHEAAAGSTGLARTRTLQLFLGSAHVYGECARIWNPIHSDAAAARRAGLPSPIMHGSGLLAMAVSDVIRCDGNGRPAAVRNVTGRFRAPVILPHRLTLFVSAAPRLDEERIATFWIEREDGTVAVEGSCTLG